MTTDVIQRAIQTAKAMAASGLHRGAKPVDLVIAAFAEGAGLTVLPTTTTTIGSRPLHASRWSG